MALCQKSSYVCFKTLNEKKKMSLNNTKNPTYKYYECVVWNYRVLRDFYVIYNRLSDIKSNEPLKLNLNKTKCRMA
jgi:hypothetical protein